jgi:hypothetical protein
MYHSPPRGLSQAVKTCIEYVTRPAVTERRETSTRSPSPDARTVPVVPISMQALADLIGSERALGQNLLRLATRLADHDEEKSLLCQSESRLRRHEAMEARHAADFTRLQRKVISLERRSAVSRGNARRWEEAARSSHRPCLRSEARSPCKSLLLEGVVHLFMTWPRFDKKRMLR